MRRMGVALAGLLAVFAAIVTAAPAFAHAGLVSMTPAVGSTVTVAPSQVVLTFDEPMQSLGSTVAVIDPAGHAMQTSEMAVQGTRIIVWLLPLHRPGTYHVNYRVLSGDGHVVTDTRTFRFAPSGQAAATPMSTAVPEVSPVHSDSATVGFWLTGVALVLLLLVGWGVARVRRVRTRG